MHPVLANLIFDAFAQSGTFNRIIVVVLIASSVYVWTTMTGKYADLRFMKQRNLDFARRLRKTGHPALYYVEAQGKCPLGTPNAAIYVKAIHELLAIMRRKGYAEAALLDYQPGGAGIHMSETEMAAVKALAEGELSEQILEIESAMSRIGTLATAAPSLGLLGTVWGVMEAFMAMSATGSAMITSVAPGISGALLTTVLGLFVAIPSSIGYNYLCDRVKATIVKTENFTDELLANIARIHAIQTGEG